METELKDSDPINHAGVVIEYSPVAIENDKIYICPVRAIALSTVPSQASGDFGVRTITRINEVTFTHYHRYGASIQIVNVGPPQ